MSASPEEMGLWKQIANWMWAVLATLGGLVWALLQSKIEAVNKTATESVPRTEFKIADDQRKQDMINLRNDVKELYTRDDKLKDHINEKIDDLRADMNAQFNRLLDEVRRPK